MVIYDLVIMTSFFFQDAFILDTGAGGIFAWLGKGATNQEKKAAFKNAVVGGVVDGVVVDGVVVDW